MRAGWGQRIFIRDLFESFWESNVPLVDWCFVSPDMQHLSIASRSSMASEATDTTVITVSDPATLLRLGIAKVPIPSVIAKQREKWAAELSQVTPMIMFGQGDGEYPFYRNIMEEPELEFPLEGALSEEVENAFWKHFGVKRDEVRLDDAFCVHYNMDQSITSGSKHMDPSDITVNMCIEKTDTVEGSQVLFHGTKVLENLKVHDETLTDDPTTFLVPQEEGFATIHFGSHPHETLPLINGGRRTNIVLTYCYKDKSRSDVDIRNCYFT